MCDINLSTFSNCGKYFSNFGLDGKLRVWDTLSSALKQEYTPNLHLTSPITSLRWIKLSNPSASTKREKRKSMDDDLLEVDILLLGTRNGQLQFYSVATGEVINELTKSHDSAIISIAWSATVNYVYTSSEDSHILEWSLKKNKMKKKWFGGTGRITSLALSGDGSYLFSASRSIQWWDLETKSVIKKFTGHSSAVISMNHVSTLSGNYLLSAAKDDKFLSAWSLNDSKDEKTSIASFVLDDTATEMNILMGKDGANATMSALSSSGTLHTFTLKLNGKCSKSLKADHVIQLAPNEGSKTLSLSPIPICSSLLKSSSSVLIAYGSDIFLKFETISLESKEALIILVRNDLRKKAASKHQENSKVISGNTEDTSYSHPGVVNGINSSGIKKSSSKLRDLPMEERLENLQLNKIDTPAGSSVPPDSLAQLLIQGLRSKDKNLLFSVLCSKGEDIINNTVMRLPVQVILPLVEQLTSLAQSKSWGSEVAVRWLKCVLSIHSAQLLASPDLSSKLLPLLGLIETRLNSLAPLLRLRGRLDLLLDQFNAKPAVPVTSYEQTDFLVYEDQDSGEEGSDDILMGQTTDSSGEDRWDEFSDDETVGRNQDDVDMASD